MTNISFLIESNIYRPINPHAIIALSSMMAPVWPSNAKCSTVSLWDLRIASRMGNWLLSFKLYSKSGFFLTIALTASVFPVKAALCRAVSPPESLKARASGGMSSTNIFTKQLVDFPAIAAMWRAVSEFELITVVLSWFISGKKFFAVFQSPRIAASYNTEYFLKSTSAAESRLSSQVARLYIYIHTANYILHSFLEERERENRLLSLLLSLETSSSTWSSSSSSSFSCSSSLKMLFAA